MVAEPHRTYAVFELFLDLHYVLHRFVDLDFDALVIYSCVAEAALRPAMTSAGAHGGKPSGSISRLLVADKTGLPRETVRRKIEFMIRRGQLAQTDSGAVTLALHKFEQRAEAHACVARYLRRLAEVKEVEAIEQ